MDRKASLVFFLCCVIYDMRSRALTLWSSCEIENKESQGNWFGFGDSRFIIGRGRLFRAAVSDRVL